MKLPLAGAFLSLALACSSGGGGGPPRPPAPPPTPDAAPALPAAGPTERECEDLIAHAIALRAAELARTLPPEQVPAEAERAALAAELRGAFLADCRHGTRRGYDCAIAAKTLAELAGCQATRSSSTSNSKVAPGGILPPAPRSP
ncbi:MAG TPA: hypothetical protein VK932_25735 [Kofleriaceae bacterium]|nr:hypothetical protein [Kofleriaceae bacterium]